MKKHLWVCPKFCVNTAGQCKIEQNFSRRERRQLLPLSSSAWHPQQIYIDFHAGYLSWCPAVSFRRWI